MELCRRLSFKTLKSVVIDKNPSESTLKSCYQENSETRITSIQHNGDSWNFRRVATKKFRWGQVVIKSFLLAIRSKVKIFKILYLIKLIFFHCFYIAVEPWELKNTSMCQVWHVGRLRVKSFWCASITNFNNYYI